jgi:large subunit ribosomal protein L6
MSRIGNKPVLLPEGVTVQQTDRLIQLTGSKGSLNLILPAEVELVIDAHQIIVKTTAEKTNIQGVIRANLANLVQGVTQGWTKVLELNGTGFRASSAGPQLDLALGFSHPVKVVAPTGISFAIKDNKITVSGMDKTLVGQVAAQVRKLKPADVYKHKGLKYEGEKLIKKAGKAAKAGGTTK